MPATLLQSHERYRYRLLSPSLDYQFVLWTLDEIQSQGWFVLHPIEFYTNHNHHQTLINICSKYAKSSIAADHQ